jgi:putative Holliday junction resolvase
MTEALGRFMAVDYGTRRIGLAISDPLGMIATPAGFITRRAGKRAPIAELIRRAQVLEARGFVVGLPLDGNGDETDWTREVRIVGDELGKRTGLPVHFVDERFTTARALRGMHEAESTSREKGDVDAASAAVLLQYFLAASGGAMPERSE